ncbi:MAG: SIR2 family protein [Myxococcales bacterium]|nr:SIR2 family protein [Myxococcales bacterium]
MERRLLSAYEAGKLVPFLGAGMSRDVCPSWDGFIAALERVAGLPAIAGSTDVVRRAHHAVRRLRSDGPVRFHAAVTEALGARRAEAPEQTRALAAIHWPLTITTNYDDLYLCEARVNQADEVADGGEAMSVLGRGAGDCQRVLTSLREPCEPILWALHGFLGGQSRHGRRAGQSEARRQVLAAELVVGHDEYRRVAHRDLHFRRAFAEVFRSRSLLFLGSSLTDPHLLGLFEEILEFAGPNSLPHFAALRKADISESDRRFLQSRLNIWVLPLTDHGDLPSLLRALGREIGRGGRAARWGYTLPGIASDGSEARLEIVNCADAGLPLPGAKECVAVNAGFDRRFFPSKLGGPLLARARKAGLLPPTLQPPRLKAGSHVARFDDSPFFLVVARGGIEVGPPQKEGTGGTSRGQRDVRVLARSTAELLDQAVAAGYETLHTEILGGGRRRTFPRRFALIEMVRGFARWHRARAVDDRRPVRLVIQVQRPDVLFDLASGRIEVTELLLCDDLRFWIEVAAGRPEMERQQVFFAGATPIGAVAQAVDVAGEGWSVAVIPRPACDEEPTPLAACGARTLEEAGVVPGCTLRFERETS